MRVQKPILWRFPLYTAHTRPTYPYEKRRLRVLNNLRFNVETNRPVLFGLAAEGGVKPPEVSVRSLDWTDYEAASIPPPPVSPPLQKSLDGEADCSRRGPFPLISAKVKCVAEAAAVDTDTTLLRRLSSPEGADDAESFRGTPSSGLREGEEDALGSPEVILAADVVYDNRCGLYNNGGGGSGGGLKGRSLWPTVVICDLSVPFFGVDTRHVVAQ